MSDNVFEPEDGTEMDVLPFHGWEYRLVSSGTIMKGGMMAKLNRLGSAGWEIIGFASADKTIGLNSLEVLLKRPLMADGKLVAATQDPEHRSVVLREGDMELDVPVTLSDSEFDCVECGVEVPPSAESCPACGWSWT